MRSSLLLLCLCIGCSRHSAGLSPRDHAGTEYTAYLYQLYQNAPPSAAPPNAGAPMHLAVAQVGEVAPPQSFIDALRCQAHLFPRVEAIPGTAHLGYIHGKDGAEEVRSRIDLMRRFARDLGMTHLFLYGGTVDHGTKKTPLGVLDLTIVGAYIVPSRGVKAVARASGALIDLNSGRVLFISTAESQRTGIATKMSDESTNRRLVERIREDVTCKLAGNLVADALRHPYVASTATPAWPHTTAPSPLWPPHTSSRYYSTR